MAMIEIGAIDPNEQVSGPESSTGLAKLNRMLDSWNVDGRYVYAVVFNNYVLTANLQPHTIGPTGVLVVPQRPVKVLDANIILNPGGATAVRSPVSVHNGKQGAEWWAAKRAFAVTGTIVTDLYYEEDWQNGSLFLWPVPQNAQTLELETWTVLAQLQLTSSFCMPPGYMDAVVYSLAEALCPSFGKEVTLTLEKLKVDAVRRIQGLNTAAPLIATRDAGMPQTQRPYFNYRTGLSR
jgi:hypothetical protein